MRTYRRSFVAIIALMIALPVFAHHGNAAYETTKTVTVQGAITDFHARPADGPIVATRRRRSIVQLLIGFLTILPRRHYLSLLQSFAQR